MKREECPFAPPQISLSEDDLAAIGLTVMLDARAKCSAIAALKGVAGLSSEEWKAHDCQQFAQITAKLIGHTADMDSHLHGLALRLEALRKTSQNDRNQIVHASWGQSSEGNPIAFDDRRNVWLSRLDVQRAVTSNQATDRVAYACVWRTAQLVEKGVIPQRTEGSGPAMRLNSGLWKW